MNKNAKQQRQIKREFNRVRTGFAIGAAAIIAATAFMNVSGWVAMAGTTSQAIANGVLSSGMEAMSISSLALAGHQASKGRWGRALTLAGAGGAVIYFNTLATESFLAVQGDMQANAIEGDAAAVETVQGQIATIDTEIQSIIAQNGGVPRDIETIERAYSHLDPETNPINMMRKDAEIGARLRYEELLAERDGLLRSSESAAVGANDAVRTVIPGGQLPGFIWSMEIIKASASFMLGTNKVIPFWDEEAKLKEKKRRKWAAIKGRKQSLSPIPA
ncbi:MAG: hypothetical protein AAF668_06615 [Pseudomonadota bacterium]